MRFLIFLAMIGLTGCAAGLPSRAILAPPVKPTEFSLETQQGFARALHAAEQCLPSVDAAHLDILWADWQRQRDQLREAAR